MPANTGAQSGSGTVAFTGTLLNPLTLSVTSVGGSGSGLIDTINVTYVDLTLTGAAGLAPFTTYHLGAGSTLRLASPASAAGATVAFTAPDSHLVLPSGVNAALLSAIVGFQPGNTISIGPLAAGAAYTDNAGAGTGGTLTLLDGSGSSVGTVALGTGDYVAGNFHLSADSAGGTTLSYSTAITGVTASQRNADLSSGGSTVLLVGTTDAVAVSGGTPTLTLNDGGTAIYNAALSTPTSMAFTYTVSPGENTPDLAVTGISLNGAAIANAGNSPINLSGVIANPTGILQIDTTAPILSGLLAAPGTASLQAGQVVQLSVNANEPVTVAGGVPTLTLNDGGTAVYSASLSNPNRLVFVSTIVSGQNTADLAVTGASLNGATITDGAGNATGMLGALGNPSGTLQIDTIAPLVTGVVMSPDNGILTPGQSASISVGVSEPVSVTGGVPTLALSDGGKATYDPVSSTSTRLVFTHMVQPGQNAADLSVTGFGLNGASIADPAGNQVDLSGAIGNPSGTLQVNGAVASAGTATVAATATLGVYRFFDEGTGTHFFTADVNEASGLENSASRGYRPDLLQEANGFGAIDPNSPDASKVQVYRFFDTIHGTHFFTASQSEADTLRNSASVGYRPDLVFENASSFYEHATQQTGDVAVYRFFDSKFGTHFYTGDQNEYKAITTPGTASYRTDLVSEGVGFYAPSGLFR